MLISRFMLNLRGKTSSADAQNTVRTSSILFNDRIIGNMEGSLRFGMEDDEEDYYYDTDQEVENYPDRPSKSEIESVTVSTFSMNFCRTGANYRAWP
jgi:hypothetical protein